jgi:hypothetical protein
MWSSLTSDITTKLGVISPQYILLALIGSIILGFAINLARIIRLRRRRDEIFEFREQFITWVNGRYADQELYMELTSACPRTQTAMGVWGVMAAFSPPISGQTFTNWPIILNCLPTIRQYSQDRILSGRQADGYVHVADDAMLRAIGSLGDEIRTLRSVLFNPLALMREGIVRILTLPIYVLAEFGLLSKRAYDWLHESVFVRAVTFLVAVTGFISAVVGLVTGWGQFHASAQQYFKPGASDDTRIRQSPELENLMSATGSAA